MELDVAVMKRVKVTGDLFHGVVPNGAVYVGRGKPGLKQSPFHNPFTVKGTAAQRQRSSSTAST
jgi:hypothetical protein